MTHRGRFLNLYVGSMASGKTMRMLSEIDTFRKYGRKSVVILKPNVDARTSSHITSRSGSQDTAEEIPIAAPESVWEVIHRHETACGRKLDIVAFDEVQLFPLDSGLFNVVRDLLDSGYDVMAAGLALDYRGEPFGSISALTLLARERCVWLSACCVECGGPSWHAQRLINGAPANYDAFDGRTLGIVSEAYEPRCTDHVILPGRTRSWNK